MRGVSYGLPAINILPYEYRKRYLSRLEGILLLVLLAGALLAVISFQGLQAARDETAVLRERESRQRAANNSFKPQVEQAAALRQKIAKLQATLDKAQKTRDVLAVQRLDWGGLLSPVLLNLPSGIELTAIAKDLKQQMIVDGVSRNGFAPFEQYYNQLNSTPGVSKVIITRTEAKEEEEGNLLVFSLVLTIAGE